MPDLRQTFRRTHDQQQTKGSAMHQGCFRHVRSIIAFALALQASSTWAQNKYSINVIAYVDSRLYAGSNLFANPLNAGKDNNTVGRLLGGVPDGSNFLPWNLIGPGYGPPNVFTSGSGWSDAAAPLG